MNDHQRKMARKAGTACGYAHGGLVRDVPDDEADAIIREEDNKDLEADRQADPDQVDFQDYVDYVGADGVNAQHARNRASDRVRRSVLKADETRPQRAERERDEATSRFQDKVEQERSRRRDVVSGRIKEI